MPPRFFTVAIIAFWVLMLGLFLIGDVWPRLAPTEPLMFPIDVVDEAGNHAEGSKFAVSNEDTSPYPDAVDWLDRAQGEWRYFPDTDSFESKCEFTLSETNATLVSIYRLSRGGQMLGIEATSFVTAQGQAKTVLVQARLTGSPHNGRFIPQVERTFPNATDGAASQSSTGLEVAVSSRGTVLNPLHPPRRFTDLGAGQQWQMTVIDPLPLLKLARPTHAAQGDAVSDADMAASACAYVLKAQVQPEVKSIVWPTAKEGQVSCWIVHCTGDGPVGPLTYWVRQRDGSQSQPGYKAGDVLRLEVTLNGEQWTVQCLTEGLSMRPYKRPLKNTP